LLWVVDPGTATATTPCARPGAADDPRVESLRSRLERTTDRAAWATLAGEAAALAASLPATAPRACAHYVAAGAHFFLTSAGSERTRHAAGAVAQLLAAEAIAPEGMDGVQPVARRRTAWQRLGAVDGLRSRAPTPVRLYDPAPTDGRLTLRPAGEVADWVRRCGGSTACAEALNLTVPVQAGAPLTLHLRPGDWIATLSTPCGETERAFTAGESVSVRLPDPPACRVRLVVKDGESELETYALHASGEPVPADRLTSDMAAVEITAPGFRPTTVELDTQEGAQLLTVGLDRCVVDLVVEAIPADASVTGAGPAPWGTRRVRAERPGHRPIDRTIEIPPPDACAGTRHDITLALPRPVTVIARDAGGHAVMPARVQVNGEWVSVAGFDLQPGRHQYRAEHPDFRPREGIFEIHPCRRETCGPAPLEIAFGDADVGVATGPLVTMGAGGLLMAGGLVAGVLAFTTQSEIDSYSTKREEMISIDELIDRRDQRARWANTLFGAGAVVFAGGISWHLLTADDP
jgi:hypothetical protein